MSVEQFEKRIRHLDQTDVLSGAISSLNKLLVEKGIVKETDLQSYFLAWMREHDLTKTRAKKKKIK